MTPPSVGHGATRPNSGHIIRLAADADVATVRAIAEAAYSIYIPRIGRMPSPMAADFAAQIANGQVWVDCRDDGVSGYIVLYPRGDHLHVENIAVSPEVRGQGIGRALLDFAESHARNHGINAIELYTNEKMTENLTLYPRLGYCEVDRRNEAGFARVFFRKELS